MSPARPRTTAPAAADQEVEPKQAKRDPSAGCAIVAARMPDPPNDSSFEEIAGQWLGTLMATMVRAVHDPVLAYDLSTEVVAAARREWVTMPTDDEALAALLRIGVRVLADAASAGCVPTVERRRRREPPSQRLTVAQQREIVRLAEQVLELPPAARAAAAELARTAPPPRSIRSLKASGLIDAEPLPDRAGDRDAR
jgi:hypothetical protein